MSRFEESLTAALSIWRDTDPQPDEVWRHRRSGDHYLIICRALDEPTLDLLIIYKRIGNDVCWSRLLDSFNKRFEKVS